jgi:hypothetical protein
VRQTYVAPESAPQVDLYTAPVAPAPVAPPVAEQPVRVEAQITQTARPQEPITRMVDPLVAEMEE